MLTALQCIMQHTSNKATLSGVIITYCTPPLSFTRGYNGQSSLKLSSKIYTHLIYVRGKWDKLNFRVPPVLPL